MRELVLLRGAMGSGKSTFIRNMFLEHLTLSADDIRLQLQSPIMLEDGSYGISGKNDGKVWKMLYEFLEERMKRGEFTIIDATHAKTSMMGEYKKLAQKYRYRVSLVDFSDVPLEKLLENNKNRPEYKHVPEMAIHNAHERMTTENVPAYIKKRFKPYEYMEQIRYTPRDFSSWKKIHHIGDIHGCYTVLMEYLDDGLKEDEMYIFVGDLLDRGIENVEILKFFLQIYKQKNVLILEGNHEHHIKLWANDEEPVAQHFVNNTQPELDKAFTEEDKKEIRQLCRSFQQLAYYTYHEKRVIVTHGGLPQLPLNLMYIATEQLIKGVGSYETDIDNEWEKNHNGMYQIHGHRNLFKLPTQATEHSFNLEGKVESGGHLRVVALSENGFETHDVKNNVYKINKENVVSVVEQMSMNQFVEYLQKHSYINETNLGQGISSFNFSRKAFNDRVWDDITVKARGLFINTNKNEIVSRSYDKFFNVNERSSTKISKLANNLVFPVDIYDKPNGYLGIVGYNSETDELFFSSKSETRGTHAVWFKELFEKTVSEEAREFMKGYLKMGNYSTVFEVITENDPHIIKYEEDKLVLLDIIHNEINFSKVEYAVVQLLADVLSIECKKLVRTFDDWTEFYYWYRDVTTDWTIKDEGFVIEDSVGFMTKLKLPYYSFWKSMRGIKHMISKNHEHMINTGQMYTPLHNQFFSWAKKQDKSYLRDNNIITIRDKFEKDMLLELRQ